MKSFLAVLSTAIAIRSQSPSMSLAYMHISACSFNTFVAFSVSRRIGCEFEVQFWLRTCVSTSMLTTSSEQVSSCLYSVNARRKRRRSTTSILPASFSITSSSGKLGCDRYLSDKSNGYSRKLILLSSIVVSSSLSRSVSYSTMCMYLTHRVNSLSLSSLYLCTWLRILSMIRFTLFITAAFCFSLTC